MTLTDCDGCPATRNPNTHPQAGDVGRFRSWPDGAEVVVCIGNLMRFRLASGTVVKSTREVWVSAATRSWDCDDTNDFKHPLTTASAPF